MSGDLVQNSCFGWHAAALVMVGLLVSGPYALITSAISAELGTHPKLRGSKVCLFVDTDSSLYKQLLIRPWPRSLPSSMVQDL